MFITNFRDFKCLIYLVCIHTDDLSRNKVATQSTTYQHGEKDPNQYVAGNAVDRDITTCIRTIPIGGNSPYQEVWWRVDLGRVFSIYSVNILFKNYPGYGKYKIMH